MAEHDPSEYGRGIADSYDELYGALPETDEAVSRLAELAGGGPVLELGVGTGRLALPLMARGLEVHGVDASAEMIDRLLGAAAGGGFTGVVADFTAFDIDERFPLAVLAINTIFALPSQEAQVSCFANVARHLAAGGRFVVEAYVLDPSAFRSGAALLPRQATGDHVELQVARYDPVTQFVDRTLVHLRDEGVRLVPVRDRYASPGELDLMARMAGLALRERSAGWSGERFEVTSVRHVSVYQHEG